MAADDPVIGKMGVVSHSIRPGRLGEVVLHIRGGTEVYMAASDEAIDEDVKVVVIAKRSARTVEVTPFGG